MTIADRANYGPTSHQQQAVQDLDKAWGAAVEKARSAAWDTFGAAHYPFQDPKGALQAIGDFALDQAQNAWDEIRETYGAGRTWWNQITDITHTPCEDKWNVIITLALPAAADALYLLLTPSPEEILENYLQPYPSKTARRGSKDDRPKDRKKSRSGKTRRSWGGIPDVDSWAAAMIPGAAIVKGRPHGAPTRWIFDGIDRLDRVLWWFLVLEATEQFFTSWSSGMREARFCSQQWQFIFLGTSNQDPPDSGTGIGPNETFSEGTKKNIIWSGQRFRMRNEQGQVLHATGDLTFTVSSTFSAVSTSNPPTRQVRARIFGAGGLIAVLSGQTVTQKTPGTAHYSVSGPFSNATEIELQIIVGGGSFPTKMTKQDFTITIFGNSP